MKIYTRTGDKGETSLIGGTRVPKHHHRIEAYGTIDELNSWIGMIRDFRQGSPDGQLLREIQDRLFTIGSMLASDPDRSKMDIPLLNPGDSRLLEDAMDKMNADLPELKKFILPGGHFHASCCHVARCVCRRAERLVTSLSLETQVDPEIVIYLNRLSDFLFVLARKTGHDAGAPEYTWEPRT